MWNNYKLFKKLFSTHTQLHNRERDLFISFRNKHYFFLLQKSFRDYEPCYKSRKREVLHAFHYLITTTGLRRVFLRRFNMTASKTTPCVKKALSSILLLTIGMSVGVFINRYGFILEKITVDVHLDVKDLPPEYKNQSPSAILERIRRGVVNHTDYVVPNIVHFIWFGKDRQMSFVNYVSILSAKKVQKPDTIYLHCDHLPGGEWWKRLQKEIPELKIVHREAPKTIHNQTLLHTYHKGDVAKMEILMKYGGIYLDYDVIVLNSMNPLRRYDMTLGKERGPKLIAGMIVARKNALFLKIWYESYRNNYRQFDWDYNCARVTYQLYLQRPNLLNVEKHSLTTPDWQDRHLLWKETIDWSDLYVIHIMMHLNFNSYDPEKIKTLDCTFGEIMRYIYFGSPDLIET